MPIRTRLRASLPMLALCAPILAQSTERVSVATGGAQGDGDCGLQPAISADGRFVIFWSYSTNLVLNDTNGFMDVFVRDRQGGTTERVNVSSSGVQGDSENFFPRLSISADGRYAAFSNYATNLVPGDTNGLEDVFVRDRQSGTTERVSMATGGAEGNGSSRYSMISADGRFVAFESVATNLVPGDTNGWADVFVRDRQLGTTELASVATGGGQGDRESGFPAISADGRFVAFESRATNFATGITNGFLNVFLRDRQSGTTELVSVSLGGVPGNAGGTDSSISADGRFVAFESYSFDLVPGDTIGSLDVFLRDRQAATTERVALATGGNVANGSLGASVSADGRYVAFSSGDFFLIDGDTNFLSDVFLRDRAMAITDRVNVSTFGQQADSGTGSPSAVAISADGRYVAFGSHGTTLVPGDTNDRSDVFLRDRGDVAVIRSFCSGDGLAGSCPCNNQGFFGHGCQNSSGGGGSVLTSSGAPSLSVDTLRFDVAGERPTALSIVLQGRNATLAVDFGDGLRCTGAPIKRLYKKNAAGGAITAPEGSEPSISARSAALGDPIPQGAVRIYQVYYRDPSTSYCQSPVGSTFNISNALAVLWQP